LTVGALDILPLHPIATTRSSSARAAAGSRLNRRSALMRCVRSSSAKKRSATSLVLRGSLTYVSVGTLSQSGA
jgi:hypothetical protein